MLVSLTWHTVCNSENKCHSYFGFVEKDKVFSCFLSGTSFQIFKEIFFTVSVTQQSLSPGNLMVGSISVATSVVLRVN